MKVEYTVENVEKCQCGVCAVYKSSKCAVARNAQITWTPGVLPPAEMIEGIYCAEAVGKSKCDDLAASRTCQCPTCAVWKEHKLSKQYFCIHGAAS